MTRDPRSADPAGPAAKRPAFVVLRKVADGESQLVGEVERRAGLAAKAARQQAVHDATGGLADDGTVYAAVLRSEWLVAQRL